MFDKPKKGAPQPEEKNTATAPLQSAAPKSAPGTGQTTTIGPSIKLNGELSGEEDLLIQGQVEGTIHLEAHNLTVGEQGRIKANAFARTITVRGELIGDLTGGEKVTITASGRVRGNIVAPKVILEEGASFKGSIDMDAKPEAPALKTTPTSKSA